MSEVSVPVAYCLTCDELCPVVVEEVPVRASQPEYTFTAIYCPGCNSILNFGGDVEIKYYEPDELPKATGWRVSDSVN